MVNNMTKSEFQKEMRNLAEDKFDWAEENDDHFVWLSENNYVAIWYNGENDFAVESEDYTKKHNNIEGAKEDVLELITMICEDQI